MTAAMVLSAATAFVSAAPADSSSTDKPFLLAAAPPPAAEKTDWTDQIKKPVDWFKWGADLRVRQEYLHNPFLMSSDPPGHLWNDLRVRARVWGTVTPLKNVDVNARLTWEPRYWWNPDSKQAENNDAPGDEHWVNNDVNYDNLNVRIQFEEAPAVLTAGRQDIILGDGWLVLDGTPLDGSETIYFDAVRFSLECKDIKTSADLIYIQQYSDPDEWLPPIDSKDRNRMEQDERGAIVWITNKSIDRTEINPYFIYKQSDSVMTTAAGVPQGDNGEVYTLGGRVKHDFDKHWQGRVEGAYQFGQRNNDKVFGSRTDGDVSAWGVNSQIKYAFNDEWKNTVYAQYEYLSGDDPGSSNNEQFDLLWGRWPRWSELYIYSYAVETRIAETTNFHRFNVGWDMQPAKDLSLSFNYHLLLTDENTLGGGPGFSGGGDIRGHLFTGVLKYKFNKHLAGHLWAEVFFPGNYYDEGSAPFNSREDHQAFLRWEFILTL